MSEDDDLRQPSAVPPAVRIYLARRRRPGRDSAFCRCNKNFWMDERGAQQHLVANRDSYSPDAAVYKCPNGIVWHVAEQGFDGAMASRMRKLAWHLHRSGVLSLDEAEHVAGASLHGTPAGRGFRRDIETMIAVGLVRWEGPSEYALAAVDRSGLVRVANVGLRHYLVERYDLAEQYQL